MTGRMGAKLGVVALLLVGCSGPDRSSTDGPTTTATPATTEAPRAGRTEAIERTIVPTPTVRGARFPGWSSDGRRIIFSGGVADSPRDEVLSMALDGSDLRCLSCGAALGHGLDAKAALLKPLAFPDGRRVLVRVGEQSPVKPADHAVLECRPSVADCRRARLVPIEPPAASDPGVSQDQRELRLAPDGQTVGLTQVRARPDGDAALVAIVGRLRRVGGPDDPDGRYVVDGARAISALGELKGFTPDGQAALVAAFTTLEDRVANPDVVRVDLASGRVRDVTVADGYDEDLDLAPDQRSYVVASGRGSGLFETVSQLHRPNLLGPGLEPLTAYLFAHHRGELLEPWLVPVGAEAAGRLGQPLDPGAEQAGFDGRPLIRWNPTGDRLLWWEGRGDAFAAPGADTTRIVVAHLADRRPGPVRRARRSPVPRWAPALAGYRPPPWPEPRSRAGRRSGRVEVQVADDGDQTTIRVRYRNFADVTGWVIDGTESASFDDGLLGSTHYMADLRLSGRHHGVLRADATIGVGAIDGSIRSTVDGRSLHLPTAPS